jgi:hypothetical protein
MDHLAEKMRRSNPVDEEAITERTVEDTLMRKSDE